MAIFHIEKSQQTAARIAGALYLLTTLATNFTEFYVHNRLNVTGDALHTAQNAAGSAHLVRIVIAGDLLVLAGNTALIVSLWIVFRPIYKHLCLLGAIWWLVECSVSAAIVLNHYAGLLLLQGVGCPSPCDPNQAPALSRFLVYLDTAGHRVEALFFGLGSLMFCYLWFRSRYVPRLLAALGILASLVPTVIPFLTMMLPSLQEQYLRKARTGIPIAIFGVMMGIWLLVTKEATSLTG